MNRTLDPLQDLLVLLLPADRSLDLGCIGLPAQLLTFFDDEPDIIGVDIADERLDLVGLRNQLIVLVILVGMLAVQQRQFLDLLHQLRLALQLALPFVHVQLSDQLQQVGMEVVIALVAPSRIKRKDSLLVLHGVDQVSYIQKI